MLKLKLGNFRNIEPFQFGKVYELKFQDFSPYFNNGQLKEEMNYSTRTKRYIEFIQEKINLNIDLELHVQKNAHCLCNLYYICSLKPKNKIIVYFHEDDFIEGKSKKITLTEDMKDEYAYLWNCLVNENTSLRIFDENQQQVISVEEDYYDSLIKESLYEAIIQRELLQCFDEQKFDTVWINNRINKMIDENEIIIIQDDPIYYNRIIQKR